MSSVVGWCKLLNLLRRLLKAPGSNPLQHSKAEAQSERAPEPEWRDSTGNVLNFQLTAKALAAKRRAMILSLGTAADMSGMTKDRYRAVERGLTPAMDGELEWMNRGLDRIQVNREELFRLAKQAGVSVGPIF
jgi:hypothetical protein